MEFEEEINSLIIAEWEEYYINIKIIKELIEKINEKIEIINSKISDKSLESKFNNQLELEIAKIEYFDKILQTERHKKRYDEIVEQIYYLQVMKEFKIFQDQLDLSLKNYYRELKTYSKYIETNIKIINWIKNQLSKIIKQNIIVQKIDEIIKRITNIKNNNENILVNIENKYSQFFWRKYDKLTGDCKVILENYVNNKKPENPSQKKLFYILLALMIFLSLLCIVLYLYGGLDMDNDPLFRSVFPMFRTYYILCLYLWTLGLNVYAWKEADIHYKALFTYDDHYSTVIEIFIRSCAFTLIFLFAFLLYILARIETDYYLLGLFKYVDIDILPSICWLSMIIYFFLPFNIFNFKGRLYTMRLFVECVASILIPLEFKHNWFMDQLTSLIGPMRDMEYTLCYYSHYVNDFDLREKNCSNKRGVYLFLAIFPNFCRCLQVGRQIIDNGKIFPYIFNIGKYTFNIIVATFSYLTSLSPKFFIFWLITAFISGCYSSFWDIKMDFGFFESGSKNFPLRDFLKYENRYFYLSSIGIDIILRFLWMLSISPEIMSQIIRPELLALILYTLEMFRRGLWNFIRVEYEYQELIKGYQISYYEELPLIKHNDDFIVNSHNLLNILKVDKEGRIKIEIQEILQQLTKDEKTNSQLTLDNYKKDKKYAKDIAKKLKEYIINYNINTNNNLYVNL